MQQRVLEGKIAIVTGAASPRGLGRAMTEALVKDERIEIRGFGSFVSKHFRARTGRNPRTGATINVSAKRLPFFKGGKELRERVDYSSEPASTDATPSGGEGA